MAFQTVFRRYELKYLLTYAQKERVLAAIEPYMALDKYGRTTIRNLYFDTDTYRLIRRSIEKPIYKEKLRIRSYRQAEPDSTVFVELKKKYKGVVYKRRLPLSLEDAMRWTVDGTPCPVRSQITSEIDYFLSYYGKLSPTVCLSYEREAYYERSGGDFRVTFDDNVLYRTEALSLGEAVWGKPILPEGHLLMEIKCSGGIPLWMTAILSRERIYKTSFSKYGMAYREILAQSRAPQQHSLLKEKEIHA